MAPFRTRIRSVCFKAGGEVRLLKSGRETEQAKFLADLQADMDWVGESYDCLAGYVLVTWDANGMSMCDCRVGRASPLTTFDLPHFVAERLRRDLSERDARDVTRKMLGIPDEKA